VETPRSRLTVGVANAILVFGISVALYVFDWGTHPDTPADRLVKALTLFRVQTLLLLPAIAVLVGWRAARDTKRFRQGLWNTLWSPTLEGFAFGFVLGFAPIMISAATGSGHDMSRPATPAEWMAVVSWAIRLGGLLAVLAAAGALSLAVVNRLIWRLTQGHAKGEGST
jgi:cytochrome c oxidase assembly factor CtaG